MSMKRIILEMGTGNDLYGQDYTKAACRAVQDALHHSSLALFTSLGLDRDHMRVEVSIGVQLPDAIVCEQIAAQIPYGQVIVKAQLGGLNVVDPEAGSTTVIASAAVAAFIDLPDEPFLLTPTASS